MGKKKSKRTETAPTKKSTKRKSAAGKRSERPATTVSAGEPETISEALRAACHRSGRTLYRIAKDSGVPYAVLYRFVTGTRSLNLESADKLARYFHLGLRNVPGPDDAAG